MTVAQDPAESVAHLRDAREYLESAEDDLASRRFKASASNACLSAIRSSDAVCVAELGQQWVGRDHAGAATLLGRTSIGRRGAEFLGRAVAAKNDQQYRTITTAEAEALDLVDGARELYALAREALVRAGLSAS